MLKIERWAIPTLIILIILELATLPFVLNLTYAGRSESPDKVLTYTEGKFKADNDTEIVNNGVVKISLFQSIYENVKSGNGDNILAPGTEGDNIIRLDNTTNRDIKYTAVLYSISSSEDLGISPEMSGTNFEDTDKYVLPSNVSYDNVIRAVKGKVDARRIQDFDINWSWAFEGDESQDIIDTSLGNKAMRDDISVGLYIVVEDEGEKYTPVPTGDDTVIGLYVILLVGSLMGLLLMSVRRKRVS